MSKGLISFFVSDLAGNAIVRAAPLALALRADDWDVEIVGLLVSGDKVYGPYRDQFAYQTIRSRGHIRNHLRDVAKLARGNIIYACKPALQSFFPALLSSGFGVRKPLLLDAEDDELWIDKSITGSGLKGWLRRRWSLKHNYALHPFVRCAAGVTVVSRRLQQRYGGVIVLHGPDAVIFDPARHEDQKSLLRNHWNLPIGSPIVLFAGMPQRHKGLDLLVEALLMPCAASVHLVLAGPTDHSEFRRAASKLGDRAHLLGLVSNSEMPELISACDIVPTPQLENEFTQAQIPAKLLEAMAMQRAVIVSDVSDLAEIVGAGEQYPRGWVHKPGDAVALARCIAEAASSPEETRRRGVAARKWFLQNASIDAIRQRLAQVVQPLEHIVGKSKVFN